MERNRRPSLGQSASERGREVVSPPSPTRQEVAQKTRKARGKKWIYIVAIVAILVIALFFWLVKSKNYIGNVVDSSKYQAIFLSTGEVYFGKLTILANDYYKLSDVYYIQKKSTDITNEPDQAPTNDMELIKLGSEMHGPDDTMFLNRSQVLYFENLKSDGTISAKIAEEKKQSR